jgi:hypothetical protein
MATLDQLPAEQRAIVELVVQRGRSYDTLAEVLQVPEDRVRELARDALAELSPRTAARVDPEWRGRVADYLLGQQSSTDARDTRGYLKTSETARAWALSLLDSLDPLYGNGGAPAVPEPVEEAAEAPAPAERFEAKPPRAEARVDTVEERARTRERDRKPDRERDRMPEREREPLRKQPRDDDFEPRPRGALSPAAQAALRRRRIIGGSVAGLVLIALVVGILAIAGVFSGDDGGGKTAKKGTATTASDQQLQVLGQLALNPIGKTKAQGIAYLVQQAGKRYLVVQAQVPPLPGNQKVAAYEVWLYNSNGDARSLGAQYTDAKGILQGRAPLPTDFARFKSIDISRELFSDNDAGHGNSSVLRGAFADIKQVPQQGAQGGTGGAQGGAGGTPTGP